MLTGQSIKVTTISVSLTAATALAGTLSLNFFQASQNKSQPVRSFTTTHLLGISCDIKSFGSGLVQEQCLSEASATAQRFARHFYTQMLHKAGASREAFLYQYNVPCENVLTDNIVNPATALKYSHTTGYGAARYCVSRAMELGEKYRLAVNMDEGRRLLSAMDEIYDYYRAHPIGDDLRKIQKEGMDHDNPF